jgi:hypothetical protein
VSHPPLDLPGRHGLPERWAGRASFAILETGGSPGANFLATWQAWRDDPQRPQRLHYFCIDPAPPCRDELARRFQPPTALSAQLCDAWPSIVSGFHRRHFDNGRVSLTLVVGDIRTVVPRIEGRFDAFILDGLSPAEQGSTALQEDLLWLAADPQRRKGEWALLLHPLPASADTDSADDATAERVLQALLPELPLKTAARIAADLTGLPRNRLYAQALRLKEG